jgi:hypothetical protein
MGKNTLVQLQDFFANMAPESMPGFFINIIIAIILSTILSRLYVMYGKSYSDRRVLSRTFLMITLVTMLVITVVKSSLALSLGLVGALSIVRFRTPIKEPEELGYLFFSIAIGLGLGAASREVTLLMSSVIFVLIWYRSKREHDEGPYPNISLIVSRDGVSSSNSNILGIEDIISTIKSYADRVDVIRFEESNDYFEISVYVEVESFSFIEKIRNKLKLVDDNLKIIFIDNTAGKVI